MLRLVVAGMGRNELKRYAEETGGDRVQVTAVSDMDGARAVKAGQADYYIGACASGQGGALSIAIAVLGYTNCQMVSTQGKAPKQDEVKKKVLGGTCKAYGINHAHAQAVVPPLVEALLEKHRLP
jgi:hypothetical protein